MSRTKFIQSVLAILIFCDVVFILNRDVSTSDMMDLEIDFDALRELDLPQRLEELSTLPLDQFYQVSYQIAKEKIPTRLDDEGGHLVREADRQREKVDILKKQSKKTREQNKGKKKKKKKRASVHDDDHGTHESEDVQVQNGKKTLKQRRQREQEEEVYNSAIPLNSKKRNQSKSLWQSHGKKRIAPGTDGPPRKATKMLMVRRQEQEDSDEDTAGSDRMKNEGEDPENSEEDNSEGDPEDLHGGEVDHSDTHSEEIAAEKSALKASALSSHAIAGLNCERYGGPTAKEAEEMIYWKDIPSDAQYVSPLKTGNRKYLTFELDDGGWNNIRMGMETAVTMALATGRTLVLPPVQGIYLLHEDKEGKQKRKFSFTDFFHFDSLANEHSHVEIISFEEFLKEEVVPGNLKNNAGEVVKPLLGRTNWDGMTGEESPMLNNWTRSFTTTSKFDPSDCMLAIPARPGAKSAAKLSQFAGAVTRIPPARRSAKFENNPAPVDGEPNKRLKESLGEREQVFVYDDKLQRAKVFHLMGEEDSGARMLTHFYAYLFFQDWRADLWTKRFVRDHMRYIDEIQCAAARVVNAMHAESREWGDPTGSFDTFHIRRGDFQYKETRVSGGEIMDAVKDLVPLNSTIYIATDEQKKSFFKPFRKEYNAFFLEDFMEELSSINTNFFGMVDQLVASRGRTFVGCYYSTFTGYISRLRGYHAQNAKTPGWELGHSQSYYYAPEEFKMSLRKYLPIHGPHWAREFPVAWRDIDKGIQDLGTVLARPTR